MQSFRRDTRFDDAMARALDASPTPLALLQRAAAQRPHHPALVFLNRPDDRSSRVLTYRELARDVELAIAAFRATGLQDGDSVAILLPSMPQGVIALIAATAVGTAFPVNLLLSSDALSAQLTLARARIAVVLGEHPALDVHRRFAAAAPRIARLRRVIEVSIDAAPERPGTWDAMLKEATPTTQPEIDPDRVALLLHTGGTTGDPKLAQLTGRNMVAGALMTAATTTWHPDDRVLCGVPLFHVGGAIDVILTAIATGATVIFPSLLGARDAQFVANIWSVIDRTEATLMVLVPTSLAAVMDTPRADTQVDTLRAVITGGSSLAPQVAARIEGLVRRPVCQLYGMTETSGIVSGQPTDGVRRAFAVGFPPPLVTLSVRRPDGSEIGPGETGEVHVRGPNVFAGYRTRDGVADIPEDGWVASGDLGQLTEDGQLRLLGRRKDIIIRSGHNIDPAMIEEVAYAHPDVRQAGAVPMPDAYAGELPVLYVAVRTGAHISPEAICDFVAERIAEPPARPKRVFILPELPLTPLGKIARFKLRQRAAELRAREALAALPINEVLCTDPAAKRITLSSAAGEQDRAMAAAALAPLGLSIE